MTVFFGVSVGCVGLCADGISGELDSGVKVSPIELDSSRASRCKNTSQTRANCGLWCTAFNNARLAAYFSSRRTRLVTWFFAGFGAARVSVRLLECQHYQYHSCLSRFYLGLWPKTLKKLASEHAQRAPQQINPPTQYSRRSAGLGVAPQSGRRA